MGKDCRSEEKEKVADIEEITDNSKDPEKERKVEIVNLKEITEEPLADAMKKIKADYWEGIKPVEKGLFGSFQMHNGKRIKPFWAAFYLDKQRFIFTVIKDETELLKKTKEKTEAADLQEGITVIFDELLKEGQHIAEEMENYLINMEREIVGGRIERNRNQAIFECKRTMTLWKNDYVQLLNIVEGINGTGQALNEACAGYFRIYENKVRRTVEQIQFLYEELVHVREALDAAIAYEQNRIMKVFTTVTTIFMPLTLVAGWYGMNFNSMPELIWRYGYVYVAALSIAVVIVCIIFFKKKKLL